MKSPPSVNTAHSKGNAGHSGFEEFRKALKEKRLYDAFEPSARFTKILLQMLIGLGIVIMLLAKVLLLFPWGNRWLLFISAVLPPSLLHRLAEKHPLEIAGYFLALSACVELAYMLYTEGPDEAIEPVMLGFAAAALIVSAGDSVVSYRSAVILVVLVAGIGYLFWLKKKYIPEISESSEPTAESSSASGSDSAQTNP